MRLAASENPFYGKTYLFEFYQNSQKGTISEIFLTNTWKQCATKIEKELFWIIAFATGDIANRQHNAFKTAKIDNGGNAHRAAFQTILKWMKKNEGRQYSKFLTSDAIRQYTTLDNILGTRVKTQPGRKTVTETVNFLEGTDMQATAEYIAGLIRRNNAGDNALIAKFLTNVRNGKRQAIDRKTGQKSGSRELQEATKKLMKIREQFYVLLSDEMGWGYERKNGWIEFSGLKAWKASNNAELESVLFSTGRIKAYDELGFSNYLDKLPAAARYRVRRRLLTKDNALKGKWINEYGQDLGKFFLNWERSKEKLQEAQRELTEKVRQGTATDEEKLELVKVAKAAKVTTGGTQLIEELEAILTSSKSEREIDLMVHSMLERVIFEVPVLVGVDCSGSMGGGNLITKSGKRLSATDIAAFLATIAMLKNPSKEVDDIIFRFGTTADIVTDRASGVSKQNRFMAGTPVVVDKLCDRTKSFTYNFQNLRKVIHPHMGGTYFDQVAVAFSKWIESDAETRSQKIEQLHRYPVIVVISDGDMNNSYNAASSMLEFRASMARYGWEGVVVVWDVMTGSHNPKKFENVPNTLHFMGYNIGIVNPVFTKLHDLDIIDTSLPLKALYESNRYDLVRENVL